MDAFILKLRELTWRISIFSQKNPPDNTAKHDKVYKSPKSIRNKVNYRGSSKQIKWICFT